MTKIKTSQPDILVSKDLQRIFEALLAELEKTAGQPVKASLCIFNSVPGSRINYISNCHRDDVARCWTSMLKAWQDGMPDVPAHKFKG